jgi:HlyD family secretion protein
MKTRGKLISAAALAATLGGIAWIHQRADASATPQYRTATIERADVRSTVSATGSLGAVRTVEVGTQVSGQVAAVLVDFNSHVKKGQLIARIDPTLQQQAVQDAEAGVARAQAPLTAAKLEYDRQNALHEQKIVTESEYNAAVSTYAVAKATLTSAQIALERARQNLAYTNIYAPVEGVVVERDVDVGQTVAASLSSPKLFVIANDLAKMQILASVDESDIGLIKLGSPVSFSVQSYQNQQFSGTVDQVRLNATTVNNVVSYTTVISVDNADGKLLPGMTATAKFITATADSVLTVPATALRFNPPADAKAVTKDSTTKPDSAQRARFAAMRAAGGAGGPGGGNAQRPRQSGNRAGTLYTLGADGKLVSHRVMIGITDGQKTEIKSRDLKEGNSIVVGAATATSAATPAASNPLQPQQQQRGGQRGPGGF